MWTNVFKIGGFHQISWFQFLPHEPDLNPFPDKSVKLDQKDAAMLLVLQSHLQLQKDGFLSTWTNSFVGPWDPSQGLHNPDEKIKLWLFLPGRHSSVEDAAQPTLSRLRVVASGIWLAPGDSEEIAVALSQALRNCIERALTKLLYMRFGDAFSKYHPSQSEELFRRGQQVVEFVFAATEESIFVHVIISSKHVRALSSGDLERLMKHFVNSNYRLPVIVSPHGMRGRLTGCCSTDLIKQAYLSSGNVRTSNGIIGLPHQISQGFSCQLRGQNCYAEVTLGFPRSGSDKAFQPSSNANGNLHNYHVAESPAVGRGDHKESSYQFSNFEKTFLYPAEAVLVPVLQTSFARSSLRRFWLQNWMGPSLPGSSFFMHCGGNLDSPDEPWTENHATKARGYDSSSNSNSSSIGSLSGSSSDGDYKMATEPSELEADADSLTCGQSMVTSDQMENGGPKLGSKRPRTGVTDTFGQSGVANNEIGSYWDWDDDRGVGMDIQALLSEFGDFGDFFESDALPFGEPPGTAESQALMFSPPDCGDVGSSPVGMMDVSDPMLLPVGFPSFESLNPLPPAATEECLSKNQEHANSLSSCLVNQTSASTGEFDHIMKAEALMTFAPEFGAIETPMSELPTTFFQSPYIPESRKVESSNSSSNHHLYGPTPPPSPYLEGSEGKSGVALSVKTGPSKHGTSVIHHAKNYYTQVHSRKEQDDKKLIACKDNSIKCEGMASSPFSNVNSSNGVKSVLRKVNEGTVEMEKLLSTKTVLATDVECVAFQASMCRIRHVLLSSSGHLPVGLNRLNGSAILNQMPCDPSSTTDSIAGKYELKKKENIPVRIAGDIDGGMLDGHLNAPVGVWRTVGVSKVVKSSNSPNMEVSSSFPHNSFNEDNLLTYRQKQPLQELLDGIILLVQQATSFVDLALDADSGDGPFGWLALQEQWRRGFSCGPSMVHAGCGGAFASCHYQDIGGVELVDPLAADVRAASVISLLQSDIKTALKSAFSNLEGPLSVVDWCKGFSHSADAGSAAEGFCAESSISESRDPPEPMSPSQSSVGGSTSLKVSSMMDGAKVDDTCQRRSCQDMCSLESEQQLFSRLRPTIVALPFPSILVGYQDDWLKTSANSLQLWEKAPLEPYALQKHITYNVVCPDIDPLTSAAADFFQQLGTVYETCKLGTHSPQSLGNQMEIDSGKWSSSGFVLLDSPQSMKIESSNASLVGSISDYFLSLSNGWDLTSYLKSLSKALKALKLGPCLATNPKEGSNSTFLVIYVVCPFPDPTAVLQTVIESSVAIGSVIQQFDRDRSSLHSQVAKTLNGLTTVDEASASNVLVLSGFSIPKLVLQIVTVDSIFRVTNPSLGELVILKETAFTVYNKARRISRRSCTDTSQASLSSRSHLTQMSSPISGMWKDCVGPRITGHSLPREGDIDASLRSGSWDNSWQPTRPGGLTCDPNRTGDYFLHEETRYMFEPLFILAEPGSLDQGIWPNVGNSASESTKSLPDDSSGGFVQGTSAACSVDSASSSQNDGSEPDQKAPPSLHCCYGWTEDWRWLVCIWTDSRGELLDSSIFPFGGISVRQDTKGLQCLFVQVLQQGCQILQSCLDSSAAKPRDFVIARLGGFYELEYLEWQKAIYSVGGSEMKRWPLQLRRSMSDGIPISSNVTSLTEMSLIQERALPSSPSPLYSPHTKASSFMKGGLGQPAARKLLGGHATVDNSKGLLHWAQSISFVALSIDHTLQLVLPVNSPSPGYMEGFTPVKSLGSTSATYLLIPSPRMRFLHPTPLQLPTCLTAVSPPLAHLLHSKGAALPLCTGFILSKAVPSMRKDYRSNLKEEWPSVLSVSLIDYYGGTNIHQEKIVRGINKQGNRNTSWEAKDFEFVTHLVLESLAAELHALSWMTVSPAYLERRTALPFHCDMVLRLRRLLYFADKELIHRPDKS